MLSGLFLPVVVVGSDEITRGTVAVAADTALGNPDINAVSDYCLGIAVTPGESVRDIAAADAAMSQGVTLVNWSNEERTRFRKVAMIEWDEFGKKSPLARKLVDSQVAFLKKLHLLD